MKTLKTILTALAIGTSCTLSAQVSVNSDGSTADGSAMLEVKSTDRGFLPPRLSTAQISTMYSPSEGLMVYNTDTKSIWYYNGTSWKSTHREFLCGDPLMDLDGNVYNTILIGAQCWMKENLKTTTYSNGTVIPNVTNNTDWSNLTTGAYAWYNNDIGWKVSYGALYNWYATVDANGLCPTGWHVPTDAEWTALTTYIGGTGAPHGNELKSCRQVNSPLGGACNTSDHPRWNEHGTQYGTDDYLFSGLPGGNRYSSGPFFNIGSYGYWWSSTEGSSTYAWDRSLSSDFGDVLVGYNNKRTGWSVRCLRD